MKYGLRRFFNQAAGTSPRITQTCSIPHPRISGGPFGFGAWARYRNAGEADRASRQAPALGIASVTAKAAFDGRAEMEAVKHG